MENRERLHRPRGIQLFVVNGEVKVHKKSDSLEGEEHNIVGLGSVNAELVDSGCLPVATEKVAIIRRDGITYKAPEEVSSEEMSTELMVLLNSTVHVPIFCTVEIAGADLIFSSEFEFYPGDMSFGFTDVWKKPNANDQKNYALLFEPSPKVLSDLYFSFSLGFPKL